MTTPRLSPEGILQIPPEIICTDTVLYGQPYDNITEGFMITDIEMQGGLVSVHNKEQDGTQKLTAGQANALALTSAGLNSIEIADFTGLKRDAARGRLRRGAETLCGYETATSARFVKEAFACGSLAVKRQAVIDPEQEDGWAWDNLKKIAQGVHFANVDFGTENRAYKEYTRKIRDPHGLKNLASAVLFGHITGMLTAQSVEREIS